MLSGYLSKIAMFDLAQQKWQWGKHSAPWTAYQDNYVRVLKLKQKQKQQKHIFRSPPPQTRNKKKCT